MNDTDDENNNEDANNILANMESIYWIPYDIYDPHATTKEE